VRTAEQCIKLTRRRKRCIWTSRSVVGRQARNLLIYHYTSHSHGGRQRQLQVQASCRGEPRLHFYTVFSLF